MPFSSHGTVYEQARACVKAILFAFQAGSLYGDAASLWKNETEWATDAKGVNPVQGCSKADSVSTFGLIYAVSSRAGEKKATPYIYCMNIAVCRNKM